MVNRMTRNTRIVINSVDKPACASGVIFSKPNRSIDDKDAIEPMRAIKIIVDLQGESVRQMWGAQVCPGSVLHIVFVLNLIILSGHGRETNGHRARAGVVDAHGGRRRNMDNERAIGVEWRYAVVGSGHSHGGVARSLCRSRRELEHAAALTKGGAARRAGHGVSQSVAVWGMSRDREMQGLAEDYIFVADRINAGLLIPAARVLSVRCEWGRIRHVNIGRSCAIRVPAHTDVIGLPEAAEVDAVELHPNR